MNTVKHKGIYRLRDFSLLSKPRQPISKHHLDVLEFLHLPQLIVKVNRSQLVKWLPARPGNLGLAGCGGAITGSDCAFLVGFLM